MKLKTVNQEKGNKIKSLFFGNVNKSSKPLANLMKKDKKREEDTKH